MFDSLIKPADNVGVGVAFSDRYGGSSAPDIGPLNLGRCDPADPHGDEAAAVVANFEAVRTELGVSHIVTVHQVHGREVLVVDESVLADWTPRSPVGAAAGAPPLPVADAMVTTRPDVALAIRVADCVPVLFADAERGVLAAAHAGREGLAAGIIEATVEAMRDAGARDLVAWIGPHICGPCYEVSDDLAARIGRILPDTRARTDRGTAALDLGAGTAAELTRLNERRWPTGESRTRISVIRLDPCTRTSPQLHSHRRDGERAGRTAGIIWRVSGAPSAVQGR